MARKMTEEKKNSILERIGMLRQMVNQLETDLTFGYIYQDAYQEGLRNIVTEVEKLEKELCLKP